MRLLLLLIYVVIGAIAEVTDTLPKRNVCTYDCVNTNRLVCGIPYEKNGQPKTFPNECEMKYENCRNDRNYTILYEGACVKAECDKICMNIRQPICAAPEGIVGEQKTFPNLCQLDNYNCANPRARYLPIYCPFLNEPLCAVPTGSNGEPQTFSNPCLLEVNNCLQPNNKYSLAYDGECKPIGPLCPTECTDQSSPICATHYKQKFEKTFGSRCELRKHNCVNANDYFEYSYQGECKVACNFACTKDDRPVCAVNRYGEKKNWENRCKLNSNNCQYPNDQYKLLYERECEAAPPQLDAPTAHFASSVDVIANETVASVKAANLSAPKCNNDCPADNMPICAIVHGTPETFPNQCHLDVHICNNPKESYTFLYNGKCKPKCNNECPVDDVSVCALDRNGNTKTFPNQCSLDSRICNYPEEGYIYLYTGTCQADLTLKDVPNLTADYGVNKDEITHDFASPDDANNNEIGSLISEDPDFTANGDVIVVNDSPSQSQFTLDTFESQLSNFAANDDVEAVIDSPNEYQLTLDTSDSQTSNFAVKDYVEAVIGSNIESQLPLDTPDSLTSNFAADYDVIGSIDSPSESQSPLGTSDFQTLNLAANDDVEAVIGSPIESQLPLDTPDSLTSNSAADNDVIGSIDSPSESQSPLGTSDFQTLNLAANDDVEAVIDSPIESQLPLDTPDSLTSNSAADNGVIGSIDSPSKSQSPLGTSESPTPKFAVNDEETVSINSPSNLPSPLNTPDSQTQKFVANNEKIAAIDSLSQPPSPLETPDSHTLNLAAKDDVEAVIDSPIESQLPLDTAGSLTSNFAADNDVIGSINSPSESQSPLGTSDSQTPKFAANEEKIAVIDLLSQSPSPLKTPDSRTSNLATNDDAEAAIDSPIESQLPLKTSDNQTSNFASNTDMEAVIDSLSESQLPLKTFDSQTSNMAAKDDSKAIIDPPSKPQLPLDTSDSHVTSNFATNDDSPEDVGHQTHSKCHNNCPQENSPVCATDKDGITNTFKNLCSMESYICNHPEDGYQLSYKGRCKAQCDAICPAVYQPLCVVDSKGSQKTLGSQCELQNYNCLNPNNHYSLEYKGKCSKWRNFFGKVKKAFNGIFKHN